MSNETIGTFIHDGEIIIVKEQTTVFSHGDEWIEIPNTSNWMEGADDEYVDRRR